LIKSKFEKEKRPLTILDFCCGHGIPTFQLLEKLLELGVQI
jgi:ubiquinone/menaquinone biosynthesis C-methylase UbiE